MYQTLGLEVTRREEKVYKLKKVLYGLKTSPSSLE